MKKTVRILSVTLLALVLCVGLIACSHKEAADHTAAGEWLTDENEHWHACEKEKCADAGDRAAHEYGNDCDADCNVCGYARTVGAHVYDNACDTDCNVCGVTREITHAHGATLTVGDTTHYYLCSVCGDRKDETAHVYDQTAAHSEYLKAEATATTKAQYYKSCVCGAASDTEYFESDKTVATVTDIQDLSKTYDKVELADPTYVTNSDGAVTIEWYQGDTKLDSKPVNEGTYKVKVNVAETVTYAGISAEQEFTIAKKALTPTAVFYYMNKNEFTYTLSAVWQPNSGLLEGEQLNLKFTFASKDAGSALTAVEIAGATNSQTLASNYTVALEDCTASIAKATVTINAAAPVYGDLTYHSKTKDWRKEYSATFKTGDTGENVKIVLIWKEDENSAGNTAYAHWIAVDGVDAMKNYSYSPASSWSSKLLPKPLTNLNFVKEYNGGMVYAIQMTAENGVVDGDSVVINLIPVSYAVNNNAEIQTAIVGNSNYSIDKADCTLQIVPKALTGLSTTLTKEYDGDNNELKMEIAGVNGEVLRLTVQMSSKNADATPTTYYWGAVSQNNYTFNGMSADTFAKAVKQTADITPKKIELPTGESYAVEYTGSEVLVMDLSEYAIAGETLTMTFVALNNNSLTNKITTAGTYTNQNVAFTKCTLSDTVNYEIEKLNKGYQSFEITKKKITALELYVTASTYNTLQVTLLPKDGIAAGDDVYLNLDGNYQYAVGTGTNFKLTKYGTLPSLAYEAIYSFSGSDRSNYEFVTYDDGSGVQIYGTLTIVASCDVQFDGSCNCGDSHLTSTLSVPSGEPVGTLATIDIDQYYESGIYKVTLAGGQYGHTMSDYWGNITWYDENGNQITFTSGKAWLDAGTYYIHVYVGQAIMDEWVQINKYAKMLDIENEEVIVPDRYDQYPENREHLVADYYSNSDRFVLFYSVGENEDVLGRSITFYGGDEEGNRDSVYVHFDSMEFYDVNGRQLPITYDEPDMTHADGVTAIGGVYIVVTMNGEGEYLWFNAC